MINKKLLIIIPCYNEQDNVVLLNEQIQKLQIQNLSITALFINDHSSDNTRVKLEEIGANFLDNPINLGIGGTVQLGLMYAYENGFDYAVQMDGDGQHPPEELHKIILPLMKI